MPSITDLRWLRDGPATRPNRIAGEIALKSLARDEAKVLCYF